MPILECDNLTKRFGSVEALTDVSFSVEPGRIVGLLGPNGSGKTTMIKLINGLLTPTSGQVLIDGEAPGKRSHALVSYLPDRSCLPQWMTAAQLLDFYRDFYPDFREDAAREMLSRLEIPEKRRMKQLSKGTREKVQLILVMSRAAKLYLLDEPEAALSPARLLTLLCEMRRLVERDSQFLIATHSPILMAYPGARLYQLGETGVHAVDYRETEHYQLTKRFLEDPERMLHYLLMG